MPKPAAGEKIEMIILSEVSVLVGPGHLYSGSWLFILNSSVHILVWSNSKGTHFSKPHIFICWWLEVSFLSLWGSSSGQEVQFCPSLLTSLRMIISIFSPAAGFGIISYFFMVEKYCIVYMYPVVCINSTVLLQLASQSWLLYITGSKLQGYPFFINILAVFSTPPQSKHETQACSGSRDRIAAQIGEVSGNKLGTDFAFVFVFLISRWSYVRVY